MGKVKAYYLMHDGTTFTGNLIYVKNKTAKMYDVYLDEVRDYVPIGNESLSRSVRDKLAGGMSIHRIRLTASLPASSKLVKLTEDVELEMFKKMDTVLLADLLQWSME